MNKDKLQLAASELEETLLRYVTKDPNAKLALDELKPLINQAINLEIESPKKHVPLESVFHSQYGVLGQYDDLWEAFANFQVEITGGVPPEFEKMFNKAHEKLAKGQSKR